MRPQSYPTRLEGIENPHSHTAAGPALAVPSVASAMMGRRMMCILTAGLGLLLAAIVSTTSPTVSASGAIVSGMVLDNGEPVAGASVRLKTTANQTFSAADGTFGLGGLPEGVTVTITAWQAGYLVGWADVIPPASGVTISLKAHYTTDNVDYEWFSAIDPDHPISCLHCMVAYPQWQANAHAGAGTNPRFFSLYNGTDVGDTLEIAPGYKLDFPDTAGNCATCHAPAAAVRGERTYAAADMNELQGAEKEGVLCEFCHKVGEVYLDPVTGLPYANAPGALSMRLYRPEEGGAEQLFFGPFDDVTRRVSYSELEKKSEFCAPCHQFSFWGTPIYESFAEWKASVYPEQGTECQTCHMAPTGVDYFVYPHKGGLIRDPQLIASHLQPGASDVELLQNTVTMTLSAVQVGRLVQATLVITNTGAGHHTPTDFPGRHMILTVEAKGQGGEALSFHIGPTVPEWGGDQAGMPGQAFAKVLRDVESGQLPVMSYWKQTLIDSDNRIPAMAADRSTYAFILPSNTGPVTVTANLIFRRAFQAEMDTRGWDSPDIPMERAELTLDTEPRWAIYLPLVLRQAP